MSKTNAGRFFEDYAVGDVIAHAVPRTISGGERAMYHALYPARGALHSSDEFARSCGLPASPLDDLIAFHSVFGKTVPDVSLNAVANLGYAEGRWLAPVWVKALVVTAKNEKTANNKRLRELSLIMVFPFFKWSMKSYRHHFRVSCRSGFSRDN